MNSFVDTVRIVDQFRRCSCGPKRLRLSSLFSSRSILNSTGPRGSGEPAVPHTPCCFIRNVPHVLCRHQGMTIDSLLRDQSSLMLHKNGMVCESFGFARKPIGRELSWSRCWRRRQLRLVNLIRPITKQNKSFASIPLIESRFSFRHWLDSSASSIARSVLVSTIDLQSMFRCRCAPAAWIEMIA